MSPCRRKGFWYLPGLLYDLVFSCMFRELRKRVAKAVEEEGLCPWLDVCCGTGDQFKRMARQSDKDEQRAGWLGESEKAFKAAGGEVVYGLDHSCPIIS